MTRGMSPRQIVAARAPRRPRRRRRAASSPCRSRTPGCGRTDVEPGERGADPLGLVAGDDDDLARARGERGADRVADERRGRRARRAACSRPSARCARRRARPRRPSLVAASALGTIGNGRGPATSSPPTPSAPTRGGGDRQVRALALEHPVEAGAFERARAAGQADHRRRAERAEQQQVARIDRHAVAHDRAARVLERGRDDVAAIDDRGCAHREDRIEAGARRARGTPRRRRHGRAATRQLAREARADPLEPRALGLRGAIEHALVGRGEPRQHEARAAQRERRDRDRGRDLGRGFDERRRRPRTG